METPRWYELLSDGMAALLFEEHLDERTGYAYFFQIPYRPGVEKELFRLLAEVFHAYKMEQLKGRSLNIRVWDVAHVASAIAWILKDAERLTDYAIGEAAHALALAMELLHEQVEARKNVNQTEGESYA